MVGEPRSGKKEGHLLSFLPIPFEGHDPTARLPALSWRLVRAVNPSGADGAGEFMGERTGRFHSDRACKHGLPAPTQIQKGEPMQSGMETGRGKEGGSLHAGTAQPESAERRSARAPCSPGILQANKEGANESR